MICHFVKEISRFNMIFFTLFQLDQQHSKNLVLKILLAMAVFVSVLSLVYSIIFHWSPWSALYFVTMTTFANGNIGDLVPEVIFHLSSIFIGLRARIIFSEEKTTIKQAENRKKYHPYVLLLEKHLLMYLLRSKL